MINQNSGQANEITDIDSNPFDGLSTETIPSEESWEIAREVKIDSWIKSFVEAEIFEDEKELKLSKYFNNLSTKQKNDLVSKTFREFMDSKVEDSLNNIYTELLIRNTLKGDILKEWDDYIDRNLDTLKHSIFNPS